jgi:hypothetical protein
MKKQFFFLAAGCLCCFTAVQAQFKGIIKGAVQNSSRQPLPDASVLLLRLPDSAAVQKKLTAADGSFVYEQLPAGRYCLQVNSIGYKNFLGTQLVLDQQHPVLVLPPVVLDTLQNELKQVTVNARKPLIERKIDRTVMNVDALISSAGTNALEVLEKAPGVLIDDKDNISLNGKSSVLIYIDDKPTYLSGTDLAGYLKSLPAGSIDKIEIMTNPPAKYDAAGNAGIINIRTKKSTIKGFNGSVNASYGQGIYAKSNNSMNLNYRNNQVNLFALAAYNNNKGFNDLDIQRLIRNNDGSLQTIFAQHSFIRRWSSSYNLKLGMDYYVSAKSTLGIVLKGTSTPSYEKTLNTSRLSNSQHQLDSLITADNYSDNHFKNGSINLNYRHQYDSSGRELTADLDYIYYRFGSNQLYKNASYLPDNSLLGKDQLQGDLPAKIHIYSFKLDYAHPLPKNAKIEAGIKASYTRTNNLAMYNRTMNGTTFPDYDFSNHFTYNENIDAAYLNFNKSIRRFSFQAGLRLETTISKGRQLGNAEKKDSSFTRNYTQLFPTVFVQYKLDSAGKQQLTLSYGRRIDRPYYQDLNPFVSPLDKFTYYVGNPFLRPQLSDNIELSHVFKGMVTTTVFYNRIHNEINETIELIGATYYSRPGNISTRTETGFTINADLQPLKWWSVTPFIMYAWYNTQSPLYTEYISNKGGFWNLSAINQLKAGKGWSVELNASYRSTIPLAQFMLGKIWTMGAGVQKKIWNGKGALKLNVRDIFRTRINNGLIGNLKNGSGSWRNAGDSRVVSFSFSYNFGKITGARKKHDTGGAEAEQNRVKNQ